MLKPILLFTLLLTSFFSFAMENKNSTTNNQKVQEDTKAIIQTLNKHTIALNKFRVCISEAKIWPEGDKCIAGYLNHLSQNNLSKIAK